MCGIVAKFFSGIPSANDKRDLIMSCSLLSHRGPDDQKVIVEKDAWMGAARLAIRDEKNGAQPLRKDGCTIIFNGEIYNADRLRAQLIKYGYSFNTQSDTEVLLCCYLEYGECCCEKLEGMFAFAIWDSLEKKAIIARDRWGQKPLYYTIVHGVFVIASEPRALQVWPDIAFDVREEKIYEFLKNSYITGEDSIWKNIKKLKPGCMLSYNRRSYRIKSYRKVNSHFHFHADLKSQKLFSCIKDSIKCCLHSDRRIGAFLSGGLDSSTVCYFLKQFLPNAPVFSIYWKDRGYTEEKYIQSVSNHLGLNHHFIYCPPEYLIKNFDQIAQAFDEPFADESMIPTYCLSGYAKQLVDVVLTGDGADEFLLGYPRYFFQGTLKDYFEIFSATSKEVFDLICPGQTIDFLPYTFTPPFTRKWDSLFIRSYYDIYHYLADDILVKTDRCSMAHGLELRAPFLNSNVCELALSCNSKELITSPQEGKKILKEAMSNYLPSMIINRPKKGFGVPLSAWFKGPLNGWMKERLLEGNLKELNYLSINAIKSLIQLQTRGEVDCSRTLFNLLILESWLNKADKKALPLTNKLKL